MGSNEQKILHYFIFVNDNGQLVLFVLFLTWIFIVFIPRKKGRNKQNQTKLFR